MRASLPFEEGRPEDADAGAIQGFWDWTDPELGFRNVDVLKHHGRLPAERSRANKGEFER
jgi:hypothetical protein